MNLLVIVDYLQLVCQILYMKSFTWEMGTTYYNFNHDLMNFLLKIYQNTHCYSKISNIFSRIKKLF